MEADAVAIVGLVALGLRLAEPDRAAGAEEVPDRLASLALHLADSMPAEWTEEVAVERQAALDRRNDQVDVVDPGGTHVTSAAFRVSRSVPARIGVLSGAFPLPPGHQQRAGGRGPLPCQARLPASRALRARGRGSGAFRGRRLLGRARDERFSTPPERA